MYVLNGSTKKIKAIKHTANFVKDPNKEIFITFATSVCDYGCIFCSRGLKTEAEKLKCYLNSFDYKKESLSIQSIIYSGYHKYKARQIVIGGNEPLNHPNIVRIVSFSRGVGYKKIIMQTTGLRFSDKDFVERIYQAGLTDVNIPIYGSNSRLHDTVVRFEGGYRLLMASINNLKRIGIPISLHTLLLKQNVHDICNLIKRYKKIVIRYPRPSNSSPYHFSVICVKLFEIPPEIRKNLAVFRIPCIDRIFFSKKRLIKEFPRVKTKAERYKFNPQEPSKVQVESCAPDYITKIKPSKCKTCADYDNCSGFYHQYFQIFGDTEFNPRT